MAVLLERGNVRRAETEEKVLCLKHGVNLKFTVTQSNHLRKRRRCLSQDGTRGTWGAQISDMIPLSHFHSKNILSLNDNYAGACDIY